MAVIQKPNSDALNPMNNTNIPSMEIPSFRYLLAQERGTLKNVLIRSPYALGDCVCAEPAIRYAVKNFKGCKVTLLTPFPEVFGHIKGLEQLLCTRDGFNDWDNYYVLDCYYPADALQSEFIQNFNMAIPDYIATCLFKGQIPVEDRNIILGDQNVASEMSPKFQIVIHPGKHWVSKTFPKTWWDEIISELLLNRISPVLIGADLEDGKRGTVQVNTLGCTDLRNKLSIMQSVEVLQNAHVVLTNDSAPYHMAASGNAHIGVFSTVRRFDFIGHWRPTITGSIRNNTTGEVRALTGSKNEWNYRITNLASGCMWQDTDVNPIRNGSKYDLIDQPTLLSWLPKPSVVVDWVLEKLNGSR